MAQLPPPARRSGRRNPPSYPGGPAKTADHRSRRGGRFFERTLEQFVVDFYRAVAEAGTVEVRDCSTGTPSERGGCVEFQVNHGHRARVGLWLSDPAGRLDRRTRRSRRSAGCRELRSKWAHTGRWGRRREGKRRAALKAKPHPLRNTRMAFRTRLHLVASNQITFWANRATDINIPGATSQDLECGERDSSES